jgi:hypothetical protein
MPWSFGIVENDDNLENTLVAALSVTVLVRLKSRSELELCAKLQV